MNTERRRALMVFVVLATIHCILFMPMDRVSNSTSYRTFSGYHNLFSSEEKIAGSHLEYDTSRLFVNLGIIALISGGVYLVSKKL
ncbi:MAG: hypothetical protein GXZ13_02635 [Synergistaceae bacterium]|nr:hypothetical protein [Synergistaceae bacterium]